VGAFFWYFVERKGNSDDARYARTRGGGTYEGRNYSIEMCSSAEVKYHIVRVDTLTNSTQKLKLLGEGSQSTYTLQHLHSRATRHKWHKRGNTGAEAQMKSLPGFEIETSGFGTMLSCMHQTIQPKSLSW
jgi:hypothetical protein